MTVVLEGEAMQQRGKSALPRYADDAVTRELCGHVYRDMEWAVSVGRMFLTERFRAHGQPKGVDLVAVVRHARRAERLFLLRDTMLAACFAALAAGGIAGLAALVVRDPGRLAGCLLLAAGALVAGTVVAFAWNWAMWRAAQGVQWGDDPPRLGAPAVKAELERELDALDQANVIVYSAKGPDGEQPFLGSGISVLETVWPGIDVSRPAKKSTGKKARIKEFTAAELHSHVAERLAHLAGLDGLRVCDRLHIQGHHVRDLGTALLPDPRKRPVTRIDPHLVETGIAETGDVMRSYLTLELIGTRGSYVVTVHLRARLARSRLSWEIAASYLPPVHTAFNHPRTHRFGFGDHAMTVLRVTREQLRDQFFGSPRRMLRRPARRTADAVRLLWRRSRVARPRSYFDYGAGGTLRAVASAPSRQGDYTQRMDAKDAMQRIQQALLRATEQFLEAHHVDISDLRRTQKIITTQTYNFSGPINGQNVFGNHGINIAKNLRLTPGPDGGTGGGTGATAGGTTDGGSAGASAATADDSTK
ncbi:hypothetical protein ABID80_006314 [Streptomyces sp. PvP037]|uniref:hypothetical protein n=1 Tax=Streptomyces sp. PvP037 TaxID=3156437 RepID=UPI00339757F6